MMLWRSLNCVCSLKYILFSVLHFMFLALKSNVEGEGGGGEVYDMIYMKKIYISFLYCHML